MSIRKSESEIRAQKRLGTILLIIGLLLLAGGGGLIYYNNWDNQRAGEEAESIQEEFDKRLEGLTASSPLSPPVRSENEKDIDERVLEAEKALKELYDEEESDESGSGKKNGIGHASDSAERKQAGRDKDNSSKAMPTMSI